MLQGERNYALLKGATGPLVYPAGFLYLYTGLFWLTGGGNIQLGQIAFVPVYLVTQAVVFVLYIRCAATASHPVCYVVCYRNLHHCITCYAVASAGGA